MRVIHRSAVGAAVAGVAVLVLGAGAYAAGLRINTTRSIPVGLYLTSSAAIEKGAYVMFCPPKSAVFDDAKARGYIGAGFCEGGYGYMMKKILAAKSDTVTVSDDGVRVNGELLALSKPVKADSAGRPLPRFSADHYALGQSELLLMSDVSSRSFDGRYFGPINRSSIQNVIRPLVTW